MAKRKQSPQEISIDTEKNVIKVGDDEIDIDVLRAIADPDARVLWAFIRKGDRVQAVPYDEEKVIWLEPSDLSYAEEAAAENWRE